MLIKELEERVYNFAKKQGYWWVIPRFTYAGLWEGDFICFGPKQGILEIEIKRSWADYRNDAKKKTWDCLDMLKPTEVYQYKQWERDQARMRRVHGKDYSPPAWQKIRIHPVYKHDWLCADYPCSWRPNYFVFAAPTELAHRIASDTDRKNPFGVWGFDKTEGTFSGGHVLRPIKRLLKMRPWWMGQFRWDAFKRSMWCMDKYFKYELPDSPDSPESKLLEVFNQHTVPDGGTPEPPKSITIDFLGMTDEVIKKLQ